MTTYKEIFGKYVKNYSSDPTADIEGQIWYNSTAGAFKSNLNLGGVWASGGNMATARNPDGVGTQTATVVFGGNNPALSPNHSNLTEEYDGSTWSPGGNMNVGRRQMVAFGTQTAAVGAAGYTNTPTALFPAATEEYDGSTWTIGNNINSPPVNILAGAGTGTLTAGLAFGGYVITDSRSYDGTNWTAVSSMNTGRGYLAGAGIQTATLAFGGSNGAPLTMTDTESWNGTSWTTVNSLNTGRRNLGGAGIQTAALAFGGAAAPGVTAATESWNGTSWTTTPATMGTARAAFAGTGSQTSALGAGGYTAPGASQTATEEYNDPTFATKTITTS